ncbi:Excision repair cross-complementation group 1 [Dermatophagoides farinae]|uniref:Dna excision repair protein ercc-1-like protein n=1 Tax=Dermatophagoides farinae TaxID=6954 RepID=A0A922IGE2_DERFA|nr:DNA excision repair protein ERCC-1-like [Dermatophagoides farinae]KAH7642065.1 dna excision repair protein ercc-1-like protein [Dermatophagoides farinae]KAH9529199.1 Excision repair cross-complementation group 1 [Dermatophagoides farinae]
MDQCNKDDKPTSSKYFKPGYIFKRDPKKTEKIDSFEFDDDIDDENCDEILSQVVIKPKIPKRAEERMEQIQSQQIDFTAIKNKPSVSIPTTFKGTNTILVNSNQRENKLLKELCYVRPVFTDSISPAHFLLNDNCCALFLSLVYHIANPNYIYDRVKELRNTYQLSLLILHIDHPIYENPLKELTIMAIRANFTLLVAWSPEEAAKHIENYRVNADKSPNIIMGRAFDDEEVGRSSSSSSTMKKKLNANQSNGVIDALTSVKHINRTNAITLLSTFDTVENLTEAKIDELTICPGISIAKAKQLYSIFNRPFIKQ